MMYQCVTDEQCYSVYFSNFPLSLTSCVCPCMTVCVCCVRACVRACYITGEFTAREISLLVQLCFSNWKLQRRTFQFPSLSREQALLCVRVCVFVCD